jgi:AraC-type DNA-binding domain-containing proteins
MDFEGILYDNLQTYANATNITITVLDKDSNPLTTFGPDYLFCSLFKEATSPYCPCPKKHHDSCIQSLNLGESYIFSCPGGLIHFTVPIVKDKVYQGSVLAGPISLEYPDMSMIDTIIQKFDITLDYRRKLYTALMSVPLIEPYQARHMSKLLFLLVTNLISGEAQRTKELSEKALQQAKINEYIQLTKEEKPISTNQYAMEKSLINDVLSGNAEGAKAMLNEMLGQIFFTSGNNIEIIKVRTIEFIALLSRAIVEAGFNNEKVYHMTENFMLQLTNVKNLTDLSYVLMEILEQFTDVAFYHSSGTNTSLIKKSVNFINERYNQNLTLEMVADHVGLNPAYFSSLFKKETGINFSSYLINLRMDNAKLLLKNTNLSLINIAFELGFDNQSYFSKVFKKSTGMTPKQYRHTL